LASHSDLRENFGPHRDIESFRPLDFLPRFLDIGVSLERGQNGLIKSEVWHNRAALTQLRESFSSREEKRCKRNGRHERGAKRE
jgi:hypothetical protein